MVRTRGPELSRELHKEIWGMWVYRGMNARQIAKEINTNTDLLSKYGKVTPDGIHYHIVQIRKELDNTVNEDALDIYVSEFIRERERIEGEIEDIQSLIDDTDKKDKELLIKLYKIRHEFGIDKMRLLQDVELPIAVKKMKSEREKTIPKPNVIHLEEEKDEGSSEQRDTSDNSISD